MAFLTILFVERADYALHAAKITLGNIILPGIIVLIMFTFRTALAAVLIAALTALGAAIGLQSCNVVRTISNKSEFYQRGDTSVMIQTKTTESYDARKNGY